MSEYISREELIDRLRKTELSADQIRMLVYPREAVVRAIYDCPPADVRENIHGHWIKINSGNEDFPESIVCDRCNHENSHLDFNEHNEPIGKVFVTSNFCPNCGADMREPKVEKGTGCTSTHNVLKR